MNTFQRNFTVALSKQDEVANLIKNNLQRNNTANNFLNDIPQIPILTALIRRIDFINVKKRKKLKDLKSQQEDKFKIIKNHVIKLSNTKEQLVKKLENIKIHLHNDTHPETPLIREKLLSTFTSTSLPNNIKFKDHIELSENGLDYLDYKTAGNVAGTVNLFDFLGILLFEKYRRIA